MTIPPKIQSTASKPDEPGRDAARRTAWVSGVVCAVVAVLLVANYFQGRAVDPLTSAELAELKGALAQKPLDDGLKQQIRALDLRLRRAYVRHAERGSEGGWLLLGAAAVFMVSIKSALYRKRMPRLAAIVLTPEGERRRAARARWAVACAGGAVGLGGLWLAVESGARLSAEGLAAAAAQESESVPAAEAAPPTPATPYPTEEEWSQNWPRFRGPAGAGVSAYTNVLSAWNGETGENIVWKTAVDVLGPNSPVVWGDRLFITGGNSQRQEVLCYDARDGKLLWQKAATNIVRSSTETPNVAEEDGGYAIATAATDGRRVYAIFANGDLVGFDYAGRQAWATNLGLPDNSYGHSSSLEMFQDRLLVLLDQGEPKDQKSRLRAFDSATGVMAWQTEPRPVPNSWASPICIRTAQGPQVIACGNPWLMAYQASDGKELWRAKVLYGEVTPSPIHAGGLVLAAMESEALSAVRADGSGDVTETHVAWRAEDGLPDICSPVSDGQRVYLVTGMGTVTCYRLADGKKLWEKELELECKTSPSIAGDRLYIWSDSGVCVVLETGDEFKERGRCPLGEEVWASPAFMDGRIYIRGKKHLFCIGKK